MTGSDESRASAMSQHTRRFATAAALLSIVLCLAGCSDNSGGTGSSDPETWYNSQGCPQNWPEPLNYPENGNLYEGLNICYSGNGEYGQNSVLSNHGDKVWAFNPGSLEPYSSHTEEAGFFRATFLPNTSLRWYLVPGEVAHPRSWDYQWSPDFKQTTSWTGYKLAANRYKEMDETIYLQLLRRRDPNAAALASCAKSAGESVTSVQELKDTSSVLRKLSVALKSASTGSSCVKAVQDLDAAHPEAAKKVAPWTIYAEKVADASPTATKWAAAFDDVFKFCSHVNLAKIGC